MSTVVAASTIAKIGYSAIDHEATAADVNALFDIMIPRDGVYSASLNCILAYGGTPTTGFVEISIAVDGMNVVTHRLPLPTSAEIRSVCVSRAGIAMGKGQRVSGVCNNVSDVSVTVGGSGPPYDLLDVTYEAEPGSSWTIPSGTWTLTTVTP